MKFDRVPSVGTRVWKDGKFGVVQETEFSDVLIKWDNGDPVTSSWEWWLSLLVPPLHPPLVHKQSEAAHKLIESYVKASEDAWQRYELTFDGDSSEWRYWLGQARAYDTCLSTLREAHL